MRLGIQHGLASVFAIALLACGGSANLQGPVPLGQSRTAAEASLEQQRYCRHEPRRMQSQSYIRCHTKGFQIGESWFVVDYSDQQKVERVRHMEHYPTHEEATERWSALVKERSEELGAESQEARDIMGELGEAPLGSVVWKVWRRADTGHIDAIYLVKPDAEDDPKVVEVLRRGK